VFERFSDRARRAIVYAQEEASSLAHHYIGSEHILLGLIREREGIAARVLGSLDISLEQTRADLVALVGEGETAPTQHIPFTPGAKKVMELSLREALQLRHNYIGTEHVLLGLVGGGEKVAAQVLANRGARPDRVRAAVMELLAEGAPGEARSGSAAARPLREAERLSEGAEPAAEPRCPRCRSELQGSVGYKVLEVEPVDGETDVRTVAFAFCRRCGTSYGTVP
jgi:ATP-dependent Clp protease ATP-binding subunit ClpC